MTRKKMCNPLTWCAVVSVWMVVLLAASAVAEAQCVPAEPPLQPEQSLEMRTVITRRDLVKTIKVEKEVFLCDFDGDGIPETIRDVNLYTELFEDLRRDLNRTDAAFEVITCDKDARTAEVLSCTVRTPGPVPFDVTDCSTAGLPPPPQGEQCCQCPNLCLQVGPGEVCPADCTPQPGVCDPALGRCRDPLGPPTDPVVLDAVASSNDLVKSVHVEEEVFECLTPQGTPVIKLVNILTEIIERYRRLPATTLLRKVQVGTCLKDPNTGEVLGCSIRTVPLSGP